MPDGTTWVKTMLRISAGSRSSLEESRLRAAMGHLASRLVSRKPSSVSASSVFGLATGPSVKLVVMVKASGNSGSLSVTLSRVWV